MIWRIVKWILKLALVEAKLSDGDQLYLHIEIGGHTVLNKTVDIIPD